MNDDIKSPVLSFVALLVLAQLLWMPVLHASGIEQQRGWFQQAHQALNNKNMQRFHALQDKLKDYPLSPYLEIWQARKALKQGNDKQVARILSQYADVPETIELRKAWVKNLAKGGHWSRVYQLVKKYPRLAKQLPEIAMVSRWHKGEKKLAMQQFSKRWLQGSKVSSYAKVVYRDWLARGHPSNTERWNRIAGLSKRSQWKRIGVLSASFSKREKAWLHYWHRVQKDPQGALKKWPGAVSERQAGMVINDGIKRISRTDPALAWDILQQLKRHVKDVKPAFYSRLERHTALRAARQHLPAAISLLDKVPASYQNQDIREWRTRVSILDQQWAAVLATIARMSPGDQQQDRWIYWKARALESSGEPKQAHGLYAGLAKKWGYYNFLSAERLGVPFHFDAAEIVATDQTIADVEAIPAVRRALEWLLMGKVSKARREWYYGLDGSSKQVWQGAAVLALRWGWHGQVISAAYRSGELEALPARFPMAYKAAVTKASQRTGLMPGSIWGTIRQESLFNPSARSPVGAMGLMQLMPATARQVSRSLKIKSKHLRLTDPVLNIRLGSAYLAKMKRRFGNPALASAAYNAGPHRVSTWLSHTPFDEADAWVEAIPFTETRHYVQRIMAYETVYEWRQNKAASSLIARMNGQVQNLTLNESALNP